MIVSTNRASSIQDQAERSSPRVQGLTPASGREGLNTALGAKGLNGALDSEGLNRALGIEDLGTSLGLIGGVGDDESGVGFHVEFVLHLPRCQVSKP